MTISNFLNQMGYDTDKGDNILLFYYLGDSFRYSPLEEVYQLKEQIAEGSKIFDAFYIWGKICYRPDYIWLIDVKDLHNGKYFIFLRDEKGEPLLDEEKSLIYDVNAMETYWKNYVKVPFEEFFKIVIGWKEYELSQGKDKV